jgi:hypothetical protein
MVKSKLTRGDRVDRFIAIEQINWGPAVVVLLAIIACILRAGCSKLISIIQDHEKILAKVMLRDDCEKMQSKCNHGPSWDDHKRHYHTGFGVDSAVVDRG